MKKLEFVEWMVRYRQDFDILVPLPTSQFEKICQPCYAKKAGLFYALIPLVRVFATLHAQRKT